MKENPKFKAVCLDSNDNPVPNSEFIGWHSRSMAVVVIITDKEHKHFLVEKRGEGCPDNVGMLCMPCGYLNWDETLKDAAIREVYEETGLLIKHDQLKMIDINDNINNNRQNVSIYFIAEFDGDFIMDRINNEYINIDSKSRGGEGNECEKIMWVSLQYVQDHTNDFCFKHAEEIKKFANN